MGYPSRMPDALRIAANYRQRDCEDQEKCDFVHAIPEELEETGIEVDRQERQTEAAQHAVVGFQADIDTDPRRHGEQQPPRQQLPLRYAGPAIQVIVAKNRQDPQGDKQIDQPHRFTDGKQLALAQSVLRAVAERKQRAAEQHEADRVVHAQPVGAPARNVAGFCTEPVAQRQQKKEPHQPGASKKANRAVNQASGQEQRRDMTAAGIQTFAKLPQRHGGKNNPQKEDRLGAVVPLRFPPLAAKPQA